MKRVFCIYNNLKSWMVLSDTQEIIELGTVKDDETVCGFRKSKSSYSSSGFVVTIHEGQEKHQNFSSVKMPLSDLQSGDEKQALGTS